MKLTITNWVLALFILLKQPAPILPFTFNETFLEDLDSEPFLYVLGRKRLMEAQYDCYEQMLQSPSDEREGVYCNRTWDGWLCWEDTPAGVTLTKTCPDYFPDFDSSEIVTKYCDEYGNWHDETEHNESWSNYSVCNAFTPEKMKNAYSLYYLAIVGHSLSICALVVSLGIFVHFKNLSCQRVTLHKNMFLTYVLNSTIIIIHLVEVVPNGELVRSDPISCKVLHFFHQYMMASNYFWMLCEGIYLHTLIVSSMFTEEQRLQWYYLLGWGFPLIPTTIHAVTRAFYFNDNCWLSMDTHLLYIIHGPVMAALVMNFFFLLNIVRVLVTKMRQTRQADARMYLKAVRSTLLLVPLLGVQFVVFPWKPSNKILGKIYDYFMHFLIHFQGFFVASIYCFWNKEVQATVKRHWAQFKMEWDDRWGRRPNNRPAAPVAPPVANDDNIPVFICHLQPRDAAANENGGEGPEVIGLEIVEQESAA
ncbi:calcitonin receptor [Loxodonta africana]|uniref:calcitonin receptor n=1 Tax=Loxodonta africana TaxID=9785 RepID=UPI0002233C38|nr:calcitonin receptor [Loxodonta africana]XP_049750718.1 calcitonin receptor [Elephas maximus indicus]